MTSSDKMLLDLMAGELVLDEQGVYKDYKPKPNHYFVAYSGGVDSTVLLYLMTQLQAQYGFGLTALHVNHNIHVDSQAWADHCRHFCAQLGVTFHSTLLNLDSHSENAARDARYNWFEKTITFNSVLLTGHHRQDRAETLLFNLMRGAGTTGLSSMRSVRPFYGSTLRRPLLHIDREQLLGYAKEHGLNWIEDPSNQENDYSRNQIRNQIIPSLTEFRGDAVQNIARTAWNLEQENNLLKEVAIGDLVEVRENPKHPIDGSYAICFDDFVHLSLNRQTNLVRFWLRSLGLHVPSQKLMTDILKAFIEPPKSTAVFQEQGTQYRFYRGFMYVMSALQETKSVQAIDWRNVDESIDLVEQKIQIDAKLKLRELCNTSEHDCLRVTRDRRSSMATRRIAIAYHGASR